MGDERMDLYTGWNDARTRRRDEKVTVMVMMMGAGSRGTGAGEREQKEGCERERERDGAWLVMAGSQSLLRCSSIFSSPPLMMRPLFPPLLQ